MIEQKSNKIDLIKHKRGYFFTYEAIFIINDKHVFKHMIVPNDGVKSAIYAYFKEIGRKDLSNFMLSNLDLSNFNFTNTDLTNTIFDNCNLRHCSFANANLTNTKLHTSNLTNANLNNAVVKNTSILINGQGLICNSF